MANNTPLSIEIFGPNLEPIDLLERVTGLRWTERFTSYGDFELWAPITEKNAELLKEENYVWINESDTAGIIEYVEKSRNDKGEKEFHVKGRHLIALLRGRVVYPTFKASGQISSVMKKQIEQYAISPQNENNKIEQLSIYNDADFGDNVSYQQTGSDLMEEQLYLCEANNVGVRIDLDYNNKKMLYKVLRPTDRSWSQSNVDPVMFDSSSDEILSSNYTANKSEVCNVAIVAGEGEGSDRKVIEVQEGFYPITNLITNGNFESDISGWTAVSSTITKDSDYYMFGGSAIKIVATGTTYARARMELLDLLNLTHTYYLSVYAMCTRLTTDNQWHCEITRVKDSTNMYDSSWFSYKNSINTWEFGSKILDSDYLSNSSRIFLDIMTRNGCTANVDTVYADGICLVDLTETFGAGNEPDKTWCDTHLNYFDGTIYISKDGYVANNLIINGSFENELTGWSPMNTNLFSINTDMHVFGTNSVKMLTGETGSYAGLRYYLDISRLTIGHKYYASCYRKRVQGSVNNVSTALQYRNDSSSVLKQVNLVYVSYDEKSTFYKYSVLHTLEDIANFAKLSFELRQEGTAEIVEQYMDGVCLIDLTETFGVGNEPSKEWCDKNIPFFEGTKVLSPSITKDLKRKELWVDARDLQSTDENDMQLSDAEYNKLLWQRGLQKLSDYKVVENFSSVIKTFGFQQYEYNKDYFLGDIVTVADREIDITMDTQITEVERVWDENGYSFSLTFGKTQPTILDVAKRK